MNWWETRSQPEGRTWRTIHGALMLASDGGFAYTALLGTNARRVEASRIQHRNWATASASVALVELRHDAQTLPERLTLSGSVGIRLRRRRIPQKA